MRKEKDIFKIDYIRRMSDLREDSDYSQNVVASKLGISQTMYSRYERGATELPVRHLLALCKLYKVSADYLLGLDDVKDRKNKKDGSSK
jgi:transcriptional regulator with XRE-family HTH domain